MSCQTCGSELAQIASKLGASKCGPCMSQKRERKIFFSGNESIKSLKLVNDSDFNKEIQDGINFHEEEKLCNICSFRKGIYIRYRSIGGNSSQRHLIRYCDKCIFYKKN